MSKPHSIDQREDKRRRFGSLTGRDLALILAPVAVLVALAAWLTAKSSHLAAPKTIRIISGPDGSGYRRTADKYQKIIERYGVKVEVLPSRGALDNLREAVRRRRSRWTSASCRAASPTAPTPRA